LMADFDPIGSVWSLEERLLKDWVRKLMEKRKRKCWISYKWYSV
jgi:hypothetical protein